MQVSEGGFKIWKLAQFTILLDDLDSNQNYLDNVNLQFALQTRFQNDGFIHKPQISTDGFNFVGDGERSHKVNGEVEMPITITYDIDACMFRIYGVQNSATKHKIMRLYDDGSGDSLRPTMAFLKTKLMNTKMQVSSIKLVKV